MQKEIKGGKRMNKDNDFVKVRATPEFLALIWKNGIKHIEISDGLNEGYKYTHSYFDPEKCFMYFYFVKGIPLEGSSPREITPIIREIKVKDKEE